MKIISDSIRGRYKLERLVMEQYGASKSSFFIYTVLRLIVIAILILSIMHRRYENVWHCFLTLVLFCLPPFFERSFKADLPSVFEVVVLFFAFSANILGEIFAFYIIIPGWDTILHTIYGFIFAAFGFSLIDIMNKDPKLKFKLSPTYCCINSVGFTLGIGVIWEFFEFFMDFFFGKDMQKDTVIHSFNSCTLDETKSNIAVTIDNIHNVVIDGAPLGLDGYLDIGLYDTMKDLAVAALGAIVFCFFLVPYLKSKGNNKVAAMFIPVRRNWEKKPAELEDVLAKRIAKLDDGFEEHLEERQKKAEAKSDGTDKSDTFEKGKTKEEK